MTSQQDSTILPMEDIVKDIVTIPYDTKHQLQTYQVYIPPPERIPPRPQHPDGSVETCWVIYIHGGYFRDPNITASSFNTTLHHLYTSQDSEPLLSVVKGYASIDYRLSAHPDHPQDPSTTPPFEFRDAIWPDHLSDVVKAINHLQDRYQIGDKYLLVGHSVGATMALLSLLLPHNQIRDRDSKEPIEGLRYRPSGVLGVCGIYSFPLFHHSFPQFEPATRNIITTERDDILASPACYILDTYKWLWRDKDRDHSESVKERYPDSFPIDTTERHITLAHSKEDGLVDWIQVEAMQKAIQGGPLKRFPSEGHTHKIHPNITAARIPKAYHSSEPDQNFDPKTVDIKVHLNYISGQHDEIWSKEEGLAGLIWNSVSGIVKIW